MKRVVLLCIIALSTTLTFAQKGKVSTAETLLATNDIDNAKIAIDEALGNEKSNTWPKTYITAAKVYTQLGKTGKDKEGVTKAFDFYKQAIEYDQKGNAKGKGKNKYKKEIAQSLLLFGNELINTGVGAFGENNYAGAYYAFADYLELNQLDCVKELQEDAPVDTMIVYNTGLAAYNAEMWTEAENYLGQAVDLNYGDDATAAILLHQVYTETGDSAKMGPNLIKGFEGHPNDDRVLTTLINYYITAQQYDQALEYLNTAIAKDDTNASFYYARGVLYDNSKTNFDNAVSDYKKSLELDPKFFNSLFNLGVMYFNKGVEQINAAGDEKDEAAYKAKLAEGEETLKVALPYFEKAYEINPKEPAVLQSLKTLYYREGMNEKYEKVNNELNAL